MTPNTDTTGNIHIRPAQPHLAVTDASS